MKAKSTGAYAAYHAKHGALNQHGTHGHSEDLRHDLRQRSLYLQAVSQGAETVQTNPYSDLNNKFEVKMLRTSREKGCRKYKKYAFRTLYEIHSFLRQSLSVQWDQETRCAGLPRRHLLTGSSWERGGAGGEVTLITKHVHSLLQQEDEEWPGRVAPDEAKMPDCELLER